jgi:hypothetical protein
MIDVPANPPVLTSNVLAGSEVQHIAASLSPDTVDGWLWGPAGGAACHWRDRP